MTQARLREREPDVILTMTKDEALRVYTALARMFRSSGLGDVYDALEDVLDLNSGYTQTPYELVTWTGEPITALTIREKENA